MLMALIVLGSTCAITVAQDSARTFEDGVTGSTPPLSAACMYQSSRNYPFNGEWTNLRTASLAPINRDRSGAPWRRASELAPCCSWSRCGVLCPRSPQRARSSLHLPNARIMRSYMTDKGNVCC